MICSVMAELKRDKRKGRPYRPADFLPKDEEAAKSDPGQTLESMVAYLGLIAAPGSNKLEEE